MEIQACTKCMNTQEYSLGNLGKCHSGGNLQLSTEGRLEIQQVDGDRKRHFEQYQQLVYKERQERVWPDQRNTGIIKREILKRINL